MLWQDWLLGSLYLIALFGSPISIALAWWGWFHRQAFPQPKWRAIVFFSGLLASTGNFVLWWCWVVWLRFHFTPDSWKVGDPISSVALCLLFYSVVAAIMGKGRFRFLLGLSGVVAILPWIPAGVL